MKGGIALRSWLRPITVLSDVTVSRNLYKTVSKFYQNLYTCKIWYKLLIFKQIIFSKYATNLKTAISPRSLKNSGLLLLLFEFNNFQYIELIILFLRRYHLISTRQFLETGTSDRTLIGLNQLLNASGFSCTPFNFSFTVPLKALSNQLWIDIHLFVFENFLFWFVDALQNDLLISCFRNNWENKRNLKLQQERFSLVIIFAKIIKDLLQI